MSARCVECRGMGYVFNPRENSGRACARCEGTGQVPGSKDIPPAVRRIVRARSGGICEVCHEAPATDQHHRKYRSRSGQHTPQNLLDVCGPGNAFGCHGDAHGPNAPEGVSLNSWQQAPEGIPFADKRGTLWMLHTDGTKTQVVGAEA